jgi:uncharacterized damage-inducible protein DinB
MPEIPNPAPTTSPLPLTIQAVAASLTQKAADDLIAAAQATPEDKATWQPVSDVRPILEQLAECCLANMMWANILQTHAHTILPEDVASRLYTDLDTIPKATKRLWETSIQLVEVLQNLPDADLSMVVSFPWKPDAGKPIAECCLHAFWNMTYHLGQVSYIQTLYGDWEEYGSIGPFG